MVSQIQGSHGNHEDYYQMYHHVIWYIFTNIVEPAPSIYIFYPEDGTIDSSETLVNIYQTTQHHILEDNNLYIKIRSINESLEDLVEFRYCLFRRL